MSEIKTRPYKMSLDEAIACRRDEKAEKAYLEFYGIYMTTEARPCPQ